MAFVEYRRVVARVIFISIPGQQRRPSTQTAEQCQGVTFGHHALDGRTQSELGVVSHDVAFAVELQD
jgi:hypothetical protein